MVSSIWALVTLPGVTCLGDFPFSLESSSSSRRCSSFLRSSCSSRRFSLSSWKGARTRSPPARRLQSPSAAAEGGDQTSPGRSREPHFRIRQLSSAASAALVSPHQGTLAGSPQPPARQRRPGPALRNKNSPVAAPSATTRWLPGTSVRRNTTLLPRGSGRYQPGLPTSRLSFPL